ncbi:MAG: sigma-70 family RNA polymerase sigma factor [Anaerolineae bacterium]|nr:sigma-70 family RNA polymerase sigma factor [Anaerolineae bacterium]
MDSQTEKKLVQSAQNGDEEAMGALYDANVDRIYRYIFNRVNNAELARDLTSDVFFRMVKDLATFEYRDVPLIAWLYRIANFCVIDHFRQSERDVSDANLEEIDIVDDIQPPLDQNLIAEDQAKYLRDAMTKLTSEQQQVVILRFVEGHDLKKTAELLGKTVNSVKVLQHRAVHALGRALQSLNKDDIVVD